MEQFQPVDASVSMHERWIETAKGRVFVHEVPGEDPPIVLMHGFPDDHRIYNELIPLLSPRRVVAFDFLGYGRSDRSEDAGYTPEEHGAELTSVLDELAITRAILVGHDASGPDAVIYAVTHPERVAGLVLLNTMFGHQKSLKMPEMTRLFAEPDLTTLSDDLVSDARQRQWLLQRWGAQWELDPRLVPTILAQFFGDTHQPDALAAIRGWTAGLYDSMDQQDALIASGALRELEVPVSIIFGERDRYLNVCLARELSELFRGAAVHLVQATHYPQHDQPQIVADLLKQVA
jgi:pimeloyl-ACP methyl ester carboxylesterase